MGHEWKSFRTKRADGRKNSDRPIVEFYRAFREYELHVAISVFVLLIGIWGVRWWMHREKAIPADRAPAAREMIKHLAVSVRSFRMDMGRLPSTEEGLEALLSSPTGLSADCWHGPYLSTPPKDPWGQRYVYRVQGDGFSIMSPGPDQQLGTQDDIGYIGP